MLYIYIYNLIINEPFWHIIVKTERVSRERSSIVCLRVNLQYQLVVLKHIKMHLNYFNAE